MNARIVLLSGAIVLVLAIAIAQLSGALTRGPDSSQPLRVGIAPFQDLAMLVNVEPLGLEERYQTDIEIITLPWEEILPAVASAGRGLDVGFGSYIEYLTKYENINPDDADPVLFVYPAYVFKGGAFVTFQPESDVPTIRDLDVRNEGSVSRFFESRIGAQTNSVYEMMLFHLASINEIPFERLDVVDTPLDQGFLAARQGSLDVASAGLTQLSETRRLGGRAVLTMDDLGFADITGFIVKRSVLEERREDVENLIRMWFASVDYVFSDLENHSVHSRRYLDENASTRYTFEEYTSALSQEYFPRSIRESQAELVDPDGSFYYVSIGQTVQEYLVSNQIVSSTPPLPVFIEISPEG